MFINLKPMLYRSGPFSLFTLTLLLVLSQFSVALAQAPAPAPAAPASAPVSAPAPAQGAGLAPFGADVKVPPPTDLKAADVKPVTIDCLAPANAAAWVVENPPTANPTPFKLSSKDGKNVLDLAAGDFDPGKTTVRILLPGDGPSNGDVWAKNRASYISFLCKSNQPAEMTFHLLERGKTAGMYQAGFTAAPGDWQLVVLPLQEFGLKSFAKVAGLGFRVVSAEKDTDVSISDITVSGMAYSDDSWKTRGLSISINGDWHFATDPGDQGTKDKWYAENFNDAAWKTLKSGASWEDQGIVQHGFGWYRQQIMVPKEFDGTPLTITLATIQSDDDAWFNGTRIGGWSGGYKYENQLVRSYTVPPSLIHYGALNTIAIRTWGGNLAFNRGGSGLIKGPLVATLDPYGVMMRDVGGVEVPAGNYDLSDARKGKPFEIVFRFPPELAKTPGAQLKYRLADLSGNEIKSGKVPLALGTDQKAQAVVSIDKDTAQAIYLRGRLQAGLIIEDPTGGLLYSGIRKMDQLSFLKQDNMTLPALPEKTEVTPYGELKLVDEIDCSTSLFDDPHPYLQSAFTHTQDRMTPGAPVDVHVTDILGKKARESAFGWFAYRIGRGKLKPHTTYLLRIEYPEDKPRYCPVEIQTGRNYMDIGWKNGIAPDDVYDNWPLTQKWQWYDAIVSLDDVTVGTGGTESASAENGFWVYFMNKLKPGLYFSMYSGGPAIASVKLYEIDPEKNAPVIQKPKDLPNRVLSFDWERQPQEEPGDLVRYAKLMGYSAISPIILKWGDANYGEPLNGYESVNIDAHGWWSWMKYDPATGVAAQPAVAGKESEHVRYLEATKKYGINYIPRVEYGGSLDLPKTAWAYGVDGQPMKPNRFGTFGADLLNPATWDDVKKLMDAEIKPYVKDNPQMTGILWRIREDRMPISYTADDIAMFAKDTNTKLPPGGAAQAAAWAAGDVKTQYDDWWHQKREQFHAKLVDLLKSYRSDLTLYYYNWDADKFSLILPDINSAAFFGMIVKPPPDGGKAAYEKDRAMRKTFTAADYISVLHTGNFGDASKGVNRADYGIRPELYKDVKGIQIFAPANQLYYANQPDYLNYFQVPDGLAVSNVVSYDELGSRSINPKFEGSMITPAGAAFSMALEVLAYFNGDARTLNYTAYTYGRGFADAHRRFAQAFLALPAVPGTVVDQGDADLKVRTYPSSNGTYVGVAYKAYAGKKLTIKIPAGKTGAVVKNLVTNETVPSTVSGSNLQFDIASGPMELNAFLVQ